MRKVIRALVLLVGIGCIAAAGILFWQNEQQEQVALSSSEVAVEAVSSQIAYQIEEEIQVQIQEVYATQLQLEDGEVPMAQIPIIEIDGTAYMGVLSIPQLGLSLPVAQNYSEAAMYKTPCVYTGSIEGKNLIIGAHNYTAHFGTINQLEQGAQITLLDATGSTHTYVLLGQEIVDGDTGEGLVAGEWDMTLFTCVYGDNSKRTLLRFQEIDV